MAKAPEVNKDGSKRKRRPQGPRIATIIAHVDPNLPADKNIVIDVLTFSANSMSLIDTFADLKARGIEPQILRKQVLTAAQSNAADADEGEDDTPEDMG